MKIFTFSDQMHERGVLHILMLHFLFGFGKPVMLQHVVHVLAINRNSQN